MRNRPMLVLRCGTFVIILDFFVVRGPLDGAAEDETRTEVRWSYSLGHRSS